MASRDASGGETGRAGDASGTRAAVRTRTLLLGTAAAVVAATLYLLFWPVELEPVAWRPPPDPGLVGEFGANRRLAGVERIGLGGAVGPEDVAVDARGRLYVGTRDGRILRLDPERPENPPETFVRTGGRPMGLAFDAEGELLVADLRRGLLSVSSGGRVRVLANGAEGARLGRANGVAVGPDGTVYFTDASREHPDGPGFAALLTHRPTGRVLAYRPQTGRTSVVLDSLYFANGVAVAPGGGHLLVAETGAYRIRRVRIRGPETGRSEVLRSNLPGFPDGISTGPDGRFWVALASRRSRLLDFLMPRPFLRKVLLRIPGFLRPGPARHGFVIALDDEGRIVHNLQDPGGAYAPVTSAVRVGEWLYLGSDRDDALGRIRLAPTRGRAGAPGGRSDDSLHFRIPDDTVRILYRANHGRVLEKRRPVSAVRRRSDRARHPAAGPGFRDGLMRSPFRR